MAHILGCCTRQMTRVATPQLNGALLSTPFQLWVSELARLGFFHYNLNLIGARLRSDPDRPCALRNVELARWGSRQSPQVMPMERRESL